MTPASVGWRAFFDSHADRYDENPFTAHTEAEVDFFLSLFPLSKGATVLDVGCGTGRHAVELAKRGFRVTGVDFSPEMLRVARGKAAVEGVAVEFVEADARTLDLGRSFDAAICLCEGGLSLIETSDQAERHDREILSAIARHVRPSGPFLCTTLNGYSAIRQMNDEAVQSGMFDPATMLSQYLDDWSLPEGVRRMTIRERLFIAPEVVRMLDDAGFRCDHVYGGTAGHWGRRPLSLDEVEAMYVSVKK